MMVNQTKKVNDSLMSEMTFNKWIHELATFGTVEDVKKELKRRIGFEVSVEGTELNRLAYEILLELVDIDKIAQNIMEETEAVTFQPYRKKAL